MFKSLRILLAISFIISVQSFCFSQEVSIKTYTLEDLIELAIENNPGIKKKFNEAEISAYQKQVMESSLYPKVSSNASTALSNENSINNNYYSINSGITVTQVIWEKGKNKEIVKTYDALYEANVQRFEGSKQDLTLTIRLLYNDLHRYTELYKLSIENLKLAELFLESAREKNRVGINKNSDILKAEAELAEAQYNSTNYTWLIKNIEDQLSLYTGRVISSNSLQYTPIEELISLYPVYEPDSLLVLAIKNNPEFQRLASIQISQDHYIKSVKADLYPKLNATSGYNYYYMPNIVNAGYWNVGLSLSWNIFDGKRRQNQIEIEKTKKVSYELEEEEIILNLKQEISDKLLALENAKVKFGISQKLMISTNESLKTFEEEYKQGISSMLELTNARTDFFNAKAKYINALMDYRAILFQIDRIIGKQLIENL